LGWDPWLLDARPQPKYSSPANHAVFGGSFLAMTTDIDLRTLQGRVVLVKPARDRRNPPSAMRGWLEVYENAGTRPDVGVAVEFPQMFKVPAHRRTFRMDRAELEKLLSTECNGAFTFTVDEELL